MEFCRRVSEVGFCIWSLLSLSSCTPHNLCILVLDRWLSLSQLRFPVCHLRKNPPSSLLLGHNRRRSCSRNGSVFRPTLRPSAGAQNLTLPFSSFFFFQRQLQTHDAVCLQFFVHLLCCPPFCVCTSIFLQSTIALILGFRHTMDATLMEFFMAKIAHFT